MGNANGREVGEIGDGGSAGRAGDGDATGGGSAESIGNTPPASPRRSQAPLLFAPQVPVNPLQRAVDIPVFNPSAMENSHGSSDLSPEKGIPTMITWNYGGTDVAIEGSWDNWTSRRVMERAGKDHSILLVLPSGIYQYRFIVDGEWRYTPDLPSIADETGRVVNLLDVHDYVPENLDTAAEFESPPSPDSSYGHPYPVEEDFAKEPALVPPQLHLTVLGGHDGSAGEGGSTRPQHVVLNHLFIEKGWASQSLVALGLTHRFQSKYVTVVLYKPLKRSPGRRAIRVLRPCNYIKPAVAASLCFPPPPPQVARDRRLVSGVPCKGLAAGEVEEQRWGTPRSGTLTLRTTALDLGLAEFVATLMV